MPLKAGRLGHCCYGVIVGADVWFAEYKNYLLETRLVVAGVGYQLFVLWYKSPGGMVI